MIFDSTFGVALVVCAGLTPFVGFVLVSTPGFTRPIFDVVSLLVVGLCWTLVLAPLSNGLAKLNFDGLLLSFGDFRFCYVLDLLIYAIDDL